METQVRLGKDRLGKVIMKRNIMLTDTLSNKKAESKGKPLFIFYEKQKKQYKTIEEINKSFSVCEKSSLSF